MGRTEVLVAATLGTLAGGLGGVGTRLLLGRLRRGALVRAGPCELLLAGLGAVVGLGWVLGLLPVRLVPLLLGLGWLGVAAGVVDVRHRRLPDALTLPALPAALVLVAPIGAAAPVRGVAGAVVALVAYGALHLAAPHGMGAGDVKLAGSLGAALAGVSWWATALAALLSCVLTAAFALVTRRRAVPHGPSMLAASWAVVAGSALAGAPLGARGGG